MENLTCSPKTAMRSLSIGRTKFYELMRDGKIQTVKIGRSRLVKIESIRALVDQAA